MRHFRDNVRLIRDRQTAVPSPMLLDTGPESVSFCAYKGTSMRPTLVESDLLEIRPYGRRPLRVGDVILFLPPDGDRPAVHRVVNVTSAGIRTKGDANTRTDPWLVRPEDVFGRVVWAARGRKRRPIYGGCAGRLWSLGIRGFKVLERHLSFVYHGLARRAFLRRVVPLQKRMRIISTGRKGERAFTILFGPWLVGRYHPGMTRWQIRRPFRLFVDEQSLPR